MYKLVSGYPAFPGTDRDEVFQLIKAGKPYAPIPDVFTLQFRGLLARMMHPIPMARPTIRDLLDIPEIRFKADQIISFYSSIEEG